MVEIIDSVAVVPMYYEILILILGSIMLTLISIRYRQKKNELSRLILFIFIFYNLSILFSIFGKMVTAFYGTTYLTLGTIEVSFLGRIHSSRFSFAFMIVASYLTYLLDNQLFEKNINPKKKQILQIMMIIIIGWNLIVYDPTNSFYTIIAFVLVLLFCIIIYVPFMVKTLKTGFRLTETVYRRAFYSLSIMALCFVFILTSFTIDQVMNMVATTRFSVFYYMAWAFSIVAYMSAYFGYIRPKSESKIQ